MKTIKKISLIFVLMTTLVFLSIRVVGLKTSLVVSEKSFTMKGIDISHHNKITDWSKVKNSVNFCFVKSTEGSKYKDPNFKKNWSCAKKQNIIKGAYHFFTPGVSAEKQFENFKKTVKLSHGDLPPVLDVELKGADMNEVNKWLELATDYYKVKPIVYTEFVFFKVFIEGKLDTQYPLWIYINKDFGVQPSFSDYNCVIWQYNQKGKVEGIDGDVDLDSFICNSSQFQSLIVK
jgi:lysozyme